MSLALILCLGHTLAQPPKEIPGEHESAFMMEGQVQLERFFVDDTNGGKETHYKYGREDIDYMVKQATKQMHGINTERYKETQTRQHKSTWILFAILQNPIKYVSIKRSCLCTRGCLSVAKLLLLLFVVPVSSPGTNT